jgi:hypothetical protein
MMVHFSFFVGRRSGLPRLLGLALGSALLLAGAPGCFLLEDEGDWDPIDPSAPREIEPWTFTALSGQVNARTVCGRRSDGTFTCDAVDRPSGGAYDSLAASHVGVGAVGPVTRCGVRSVDGSIGCRSSSPGFAYRRTPADAYDGPFTKIHCTPGGCCALRAADAHPFCFESVSPTELAQFPAPSVAMRDVAAMRVGACGVREDDGGLECWGTDGVPELTEQVETALAGATGDYVQLEAQGSASTPFAGCAVAAGGAVECWGALGDGALTPAPSSACSRCPRPRTRRT